MFVRDVRAAGEVRVSLRRSICLHTPSADPSGMGVRTLRLPSPRIPASGGLITEFLRAHPTDVVTGALVRPEDPEAIAAAVVRLLADAALCRRLGAAGRRRYGARFNRERMAVDTPEVCESVLAGSEVAA